MFNDLAYAQDAATAMAGGPLGAFLPLILIFVVFYFLLIRPQQKRQKQHLSMIDALKAGDTILTTGGVYGTITSVIDTATFMVEIANGVKVKVAKGGVASRIDPISHVEVTEKK